MFKRIVLNFILVLLWHLIILFFSKKLDESVFDSQKYIYLEKKWEQNGKFYTNILKIKKWKDLLPQYISKNGFSKKSIMLNSARDKKYIDRFILETCRAEWNHLMCSMYGIVLFFINFIIKNSWIYSVMFSFLAIIANLPYLFIQRFNRIRLNKYINNNKNIVTV